MTSPKGRTTRTTTAPVVDVEDVDDSTVDGTEDDAVVGTDNSAQILEHQRAMAAMQAQINQLLAEKGIPADPVEAKIQALQAHVKAHANASPLAAEAYAPVLDHVAKFESGATTDRQANKARIMLDDLHAQYPGHELAYSKQLAKELHLLLLDDPEDD